MEQLNKILSFVYSYCTDFIINLANISGLSYYEMNALIFCFIYPVLLILLIAVYFLKKRELSKIKKAAS